MVHVRLRAAMLQDISNILLRDECLTQYWFNLLLKLGTVSFSSSYVANRGQHYYSLLHKPSSDNTRIC